MHAWPRPSIPTVPGSSAPPLIFDTASQRLREARPGDGLARLYVCGITPYDATHIGHAATYLAFDTLQRVWLDGGFTVRYAQNVTDVDDPLLERATDTGVDWRELAHEQVQLFREDMTALGVIPPDDYVAVTETIDAIAEATAQLIERGIGYRVPTADSSVDGDSGDDVYFDITRAESESPWTLGSESGYDLATMLQLSRERGGDPDRPGKRNALDPLLWRAARDTEPSWPTRIGAGRPGWHIECAAIALDRLGTDFLVQGGGSDLVFPHHEMSAAHGAALSGHPLAQLYMHSGMVAFRGEKMSKSLGNLVLVSRLRESGVDSRAIRLAIAAHHYRSDWEWTDLDVAAALERLSRWSQAVDGDNDADAQAQLATIDAIRGALHDDLDTPRALEVVDAWLDRSGPDSSLVVAAAIDALLGIRL